MTRTDEKLVWDWWPLTRFLTVLLVFGLAAHFWLGWRVDLRHLLSLPFNIFEIMSFFAMISFALAHVYLLILTCWDIMPDKARHTVDDLEHNEATRMMREAMSGLSKEHKSALMLCDVEGLACDDAARKLGVLTGTIRSRLSRGRRQLRRRFQALQASGH